MSRIMLPDKDLEFKGPIFFYKTTDDDIKCYMSNQNSRINFDDVVIPKETKVAELLNNKGFFIQTSWKKN